uniref:Uncharacterized protein n=1 Tax=Acrobeloides nanus TaxID=290746 RepID=A0A914DNW0_9BILA
MIVWQHVICDLMSVSVQIIIAIPITYAAYNSNQSDSPNSIDSSNSSNPLNPSDSTDPSNLLIRPIRLSRPILSDRYNPLDSSNTVRFLQSLRLGRSCLIFTIRPTHPIRRSVQSVLFVRSFKSVQSVQSARSVQSIHMIRPVCSIRPIFTICSIRLILAIILFIQKIFLGFYLYNDCANSYNYCLYNNCSIPAFMINFRKVSP